MRVVAFLVASTMFSSTCLAQNQGNSTFGTVSFYGDSMTYRSDWNCSGVPNSANNCSQIKAEGSYPTHVPHPQPQWTTPLFEVVSVDGRSGSTCHPRTAKGDPGLLSRLTYNGETRIAVMMGINDVNLAGKSVAQTVDCLKAAWTIIADEFGAEPLAIMYPPIDSQTTVWSFAGTSGTYAAQNTQLLNQAIYTAAQQFNSTRSGSQKRVYTISMPSYQPQPQYGYTYDGVHPTPLGANSMALYFVWSFW